MYFFSLYFDTMNSYLSSLQALKTKIQYQNGRKTIITHNASSISLRYSPFERSWNVLAHFNWNSLEMATQFTRKRVQSVLLAFGSTWTDEVTMESATFDWTLSPKRLANAENRNSIPGQSSHQQNRKPQKFLWKRRISWICWHQTYVITK